MANPAFYYYLKDSGLKENSIQEHIKNMERFTAWTKENQFEEITPIRYQDLLNYVQHMKSKSLSVQTINIRLSSIRKYFEHLKQEGAIENNPARRLYVRSRVRKVIHDPLNYTELEQLYNEYSKPKEYYREARDLRAHERNTIILGLMIWQGIHSGELGKIEIQHLKLNEGIIYIPGTRRSNGRELKLESRQIITLHKYLSAEAQRRHDITETKFTSEYLFTSNPHNTISHIVNELKGINQVIKNAQHIRASIILHWLRMYDKRTVQYMTGHKWISSTEHYEVQELEGLTDLLQKHHPFS